MIVLGIDPGSHQTGWGVIRTGASRMHHVASGTIRAGAGDLAARLLTIADGLEAVLREHRPTDVAIEAIFHHRNSQSALKLGQARGAALVCVARSGAALFEYTPAEIKRAVASHGRAPKEQVQRMVRLLLGFQGELGLDASDALATAICHASAGSTTRRRR